MKYAMYLPIAASARFEVESDEDLTDDQVRELMLRKGEAVGSLCHQCGKHIESDLEMAYDLVQDGIDEYEISREGD